jgi:cell wall-associated NlpC family hydrolase
MTSIERTTESLAKIAVSAVGTEWYGPVGFVQWIFRHADIELPNDLVELWSQGEVVIGSDLRDADVVFRTLGPGQRLPNGLNAGHLGIFVTCDGARAIVHVSPWDGHVMHVSINEFLTTHGGAFRGTRRYVASS